MRIVVASSASVLAVTVLGCGSPFVVTDSFTPPAEGPFASQPDSLHDYVVGTELRLDVRAGRAFVDLGAVEVVSKDPELVAVVEQVRVDDEIRVHLKTLQVGTVELALLDERQRPIEERVIEVKLPDAIELAVNIDRDKGYTIPVIDPANLLLAENGAATFPVTYKNDGEELMGSNVLRGASDTIVVDNPTRKEPDREFLTLRAPATAQDLVEVPLSVNGEVITTLGVRVASPSEIASIELDEGTLPAWKNGGDRFTVWAKAFTESAAPVFGMPFAWTFDSEVVEGDGDLFSYAYAGGERRRIQVGAGNEVNDLTVEAAAGTAEIATTANAGCTAAPGAPFALALALLAWRRRSARG